MLFVDTAIRISYTITIEVVQCSGLPAVVINGNVFCRDKQDIFVYKLKAMLYGEMCRRYDERQVMVSYAEYFETPDEQGLEKLCCGAIRKAGRDVARLYSAKKNLC